MKKSSSFFEYSKVPRINFYLKQTSIATKPQQIMMSMTVQGQRMRIYTKQRVEPVFWDSDSMRCHIPLISNERRTVNRLNQINSYLDRIYTDVTQIDRQRAAEGLYLSKSDLRESVKNVYTPFIYSLSPVAYFKSIVDHFESAVCMRGSLGSHNSKKTYNNAIERLISYCNESGIQISGFNDLNRHFFQGFQEYLFSKRYKVKGIMQGYSLNTVVNTVKVIKSLLHKAYNEGLTNNDSFNRVNTFLPADICDKVYLNEEELLRIINYKPTNARYMEVRDMFVISAYTSLRISDLVHLNDSVITNDSIVIVQQKTKNKVCIPILKEIVPLISKYVGENKQFPVISQQYANKAIKEIAKYSGITQDIAYKENIGGIVRYSKRPKYELISFHTARRSCITNLYKRGYSVNYIMSMSGHKSIQAIQRYIKASDEEMSAEFMKALRRDKAM